MLEFWNQDFTGIVHQITLGKEYIDLFTLTANKM